MWWLHLLAMNSENEATGNRPAVIEISLHLFALCARRVLSLALHAA